MTATPQARTAAEPRARPPSHISASRISAIACSHPACSYSQREVLALLGLEGDEFAERIFERCGVKRRQLELGAGELAQNLQARTALVEDRLLEHATRAIDQLDVDPMEIGTLVTSTLYSLGGPTLAHRLIEHYEMVSDADDPSAENDDDENQCAEAADESKSQSVLLFLFFLFRLFFALGLRNDVLFLLGLS